MRVANDRGRRLHYAPLIDLFEAGAAWHRRLPEARAVVVSSVTAAFFVRPRVPYAIRFDSPAALNRPGAMGLWQRALEPGVLARADALLPWSREAMGPYGFESIPLGVPIERIAHAATRDITALAYAGNPHKRRLELLAAAWAGMDGRLVVGGIDADAGRAWLARHGVAGAARAWSGRGSSRATSGWGCSGGRGCSCRRRASRTTGSRRWRRSRPARSW